MRRRNILAGAALVLVCCSPVRTNAAPPAEESTKTAQVANAKAMIDPEKEKLIRQLLELTGAPKMAVQVAQKMIDSQKQSNSSIPQEFWTAFSKKLKAEDITDLIVPIYDKYYAKEDLQGLIAFYQTPLGQKLLSTLPAITEESSAAGEKWGRMMAEEVMNEMQQNAPPPKAAPAKPKSKTAPKSKGKKSRFRFRNSFSAPVALSNK